MIAGTFVIVVKGTHVRRDQTSAQIGRELGLAAATVQKYARDRRIPCDLTPGGHRRFNLHEVREALYSSSPSLGSPPFVVDGGLGSGAPIAVSPAAAAERDTRALVAVAHDEDGPPTTALEELFAHARRVLVTTSG